MVTECKTEQAVGQSSGVDMFPKFFGQNLHYLKLNVTEQVFEASTQNFTTLAYASVLIK